MDPTTRGVRLLYDDQGGEIFDITVPPGAFDARTKMAGETNSGGTAFAYLSPGGPGGIVKVGSRETGRS